jgi:phosphoribosylanthranilate isomerase
MIIKVCGLNDAENLMDLCMLKIDMVGYNFYKPSPRYLDHLMPELPVKPAPLNIFKVGVFVNMPFKEICKIKDQHQLDYAQLHGDESLYMVKKVQSIIPVIKVFRINDQFDPSILKKYNFCDYFLFDKATDKYGGSGQKFDWQIVNDWKIDRPFLLSGGIGPEDVEFLTSTNLYNPNYCGVDINSKFELKPGFKNVQLIEKFIKEAEPRWKHSHALLLRDYQ